jgi:aspartate/methionine/tyrosine aminotransferase
MGFCRKATKAGSRLSTEDKKRPDLIRRKTMNPLAEELNETIQRLNPSTFELLSSLGKKMYFPKGILAQSAEAKKGAHKFNATIGIALQNGIPMYLPCIASHFSGLTPAEIFPYSTFGKPELRSKWREKMMAENPLLAKKDVGSPIVTSGITHGLSLVGDLFVDEGDTVVIPDKMWGNYRLTYAVRGGADVQTFPFYDGDGFNLKGFGRLIAERGDETGKLVILLNFPSNPTGYTPTVAEAEKTAAAILRTAEAGCNIVAVSDDAYFGLVYEEGRLTESLFGYLANLHKRVLSIKLDGATKEEFVWGFRTGFLTYGPGDEKNDPALFEALEKKTLGVIRSSISNSPHPSQSIVYKALESPSFAEEKRQKFELLKARAMRLKEVLKNPKYDEVFSVYPFNSGYFMCIRLKTVDAETLRKHLLANYGLGVISIGKEDLRIAFSCLDEDQIEEVFDTIHKGAKELE